MRLQPDTFNGMDTLREHENSFVTFYNCDGWENILSDNKKFVNILSSYKTSANLIKCVVVHVITCDDTDSVFKTVRHLYKQEAAELKHNDILTYCVLYKVYFCYSTIYVLPTNVDVTYLKCYSCLSVRHSLVKFLV